MNVVFDPLVPLWVLAAVACGIAIFAAFALWRGLKGWWLRALAALVVALGLSNPSIQSETREGLADLVVVMVDDSSSQSIADRSAQTEAALNDLLTTLNNRPATEVRVVRVGDDSDDRGTLLMTRLNQVLDEEPVNRLAGVFIVSDGQIQDMSLAGPMPAPVHLFLTGQDTDWDRRLIVTSAPAFAILGEPTKLRLKIEDQGAAPSDVTAVLNLSVDGNAPQRFELPLNQEVEVEMTLPHGGMNVLQFSTPVQDGELTDRNNAVVAQINGVRDRLRVLLVSGEPHPGERTWRNLLKSDGSVDLVHFTILRPPGKFDGVPITELSLIAFPTRELFLEKIDEFDLIIFDRYRRRGILPNAYLQNIANYVREGGAVLVAAGPAFGSAESLYRSELANVLPARPTVRVIEEGIMPKISDQGLKHPITEDLASFAGDEPWGRWMRQIEVEQTSGDVIMTGKDDLPLLIVDRVGEGRVALLASDHAWLWDRGFEGGGPQGELLKRLAHWMMKEPELEEETLTAAPSDGGMTVTRRTMAEDAPGPLTVVTPGGETQVLTFELISPGKYQVQVMSDEQGLFRLSADDKDAVAAIGPPSPREFVRTVATDALMGGWIDGTNGGVYSVNDTTPRLRDVRRGRPATGRGWMGLTPRSAFAVTEVRTAPMVPMWVYLLLSAGLLTLAWLREGRN